MKKIILFPLLTLALLLIASCSINDAPMDLNLEDNITLKSGKKHFVPFKSTFKLWSDPAIPGPTIELTVYGSGNATHMGKTDLVVTETITTQEPPFPWSAEARVVATAANGDELHFDYTSIIDPSGLAPGGDFNLIVVGTCVIIGGTGRFEDASGILTYNGIFNVDTSSGTATFNGEIMY